MTSFFEFAAAIRELVPDMPVSKRVFLAKHMADLMSMGHTHIPFEGMQSILYWLKVTHEISEYQYLRINDLILECEKMRSVEYKEVEYKEIGYNEKSDALLKMWMDDELTDKEYNRIMDRLNKKVEQ